MKLRQPKESEIQAQCLMFLKLHRILAWRNNSTGVYDPNRKVFRTFQGMKGTSDILGCLPGGRLLAVEVKAPKGKLREDQAVFLDAVRALGGLALVARSVTELEDALRLEGVIPC